MNKYLKKLTLKQLEEIMTVFYGEEVEIDKENIDIKANSKLIVEIGHDDYTDAYVEVTHYLDDYAIENKYIRKYCYNSYEYWSGYQRIDFIQKMYQIFGQEYLTDCPTKLRKKIIEEIDSSIKSSNYVKSSFLSKIKNLEKEIQNNYKSIERVKEDMKELRKMKNLLNNEDIETK